MAEVVVLDSKESSLFSSTSAVDILRCFCFRPCILIFDSLAGASRSRVVATLRDYLRIEYKVKQGKEREFNKDTIKGSTPRVPQQTNFTDCGVYVLQYVESFFQVTVNKLFTF
jgi:Ulp1 family protease